MLRNTDNYFISEGITHPKNIENIVVLNNNNKN